MNSYTKINIILIVITIIIIAATAFMYTTFTAVTIYAEAVESTDSALINKAIQVQNEKYEIFQGENASASKLKTLISTAMNDTYTNVDFIYNNKEFEKSQLQNLSSMIQSNKKYSVKCQYDDTGLINKIEIKDKE